MSVNAQDKLDPVSRCFQVLNVEPELAYIKKAREIIGAFKNTEEFLINWNENDKQKFPYLANKYQTEKAEIKVNQHKIKIEFSITDDFTFDKGEDQTYIKASPLDSHNLELAKRIFIDIYEVSTRHRGQGLSEVLLAQLFVMAPHIETIEAVYGMTNADVFEKNYFISGNEIKAAESTPLSKSLKKFGFIINEVDFGYDGPGDNVIVEYKGKN